LPEAVERGTNATLSFAHAILGRRSLCRELDNLGIPIWLDGGWAVDALLGEQTRHHEDLDIVIEQRHLSRLCEHLRSKGYANVPRDDTSRWNFVLGDDQGRQVDIHVISFFDGAGNGIYGPAENRVLFPVGSLAVKGTIGGYTVNCFSPEQLVEFHTGYKLDRNDFLDVKALCEKFNVEMPEEHKSYWRAQHSPRTDSAGTGRMERRAAGGAPLHT
jgi:lincosamide nucleotidyltransferase A/C/D/E